MARSISTLLGVGLILLWATGVGSIGITGWLPWMDLVAAGIAFVIAVLPMSRVSRTGACFGLAIGLFALWLVAISTPVTSWFSWWNFAFGIAYLIAGLVAGTERENLITTLFGRREYYADRLGTTAHIPYGTHAQSPHLYDLERNGRFLEDKYLHRKHYAGQGPRDYQRSDQRIEEEIVERLTLNHLVDATHIYLQVNFGEVTLRGEVPDRRAKFLAESIADSVWGVKSVNNALFVRARPRSERAA